MRLGVLTITAEGKPDLAGLPSKRCGFVKHLLLGDQNLFDGGRSLSYFDILLRSLRRAICKFHTKIGQVHRSNKADSTVVFDGQLTGVTFIALVGHGVEDEGSAIRSLEVPRVKKAPFVGWVPGSVR